MGICTEVENATNNASDLFLITNIIGHIFNFIYVI